LRAKVVIYAVDIVDHIESTRRGAA